MKPQWKIGMRTIKTCIAVLICLVYALLLKRSPISTAAISAIICVKPTTRDMWKIDIIRSSAAVMGGVIGLMGIWISTLIPFYDAGIYVLFIPLFVLLDIWLCNGLDMKDTVVVSAIMVVIVMSRIDVDTTSRVLSAVNRVIDMVVGITVATLVNLLVAPPGKKTQKNQEDASVQGELRSVLEDLLPYYEQTAQPEPVKAEKEPAEHNPDYMLYILDEENRQEPAQQEPSIPEPTPQEPAQQKPTSQEPTSQEPADETKQ